MSGRGTLWDSEEMRSLTEHNSNKIIKTKLWLIPLSCVLVYGSKESSESETQTDVAGAVGTITLYRFRPQQT